jgi:phospho-N-acetylmuramoyl-pentapeptide-transferase
MCLVVTFAYGVIGFTDDFIKTKSKNNQGLTAKQKIIFQLFVSVIISTYAFSSHFVGSTIILPFSLKSVDIGYFALPYYAFIFLAFTNAVNLIDGLDGLAGKTSVAYLVFFAILVFVIAKTEIEGEEYNLISFALILSASLCGFLLFNSFPAKIFMGDTGSLALGGAIGSLAVLSKLSLYAPILGFAYVVTCLSDIIQVVYFKKTGKRIFKIAPLHHHFEKCGIHENHIVTAYTIITVFIGVLTVGLTHFLSLN